MRTRFGEFVLDCDTRRLERQGRAVHLTGKAFDLLREAAPEARGWFHYDGRALPPTRSETYVGRDEACEVFLPVRCVSRRHGRIIIEAEFAALTERSEGDSSDG